VRAPAVVVEAWRRGAPLLVRWLRQRRAVAAGTVAAAAAQGSGSPGGTGALDFLERVFGAAALPPSAVAGGPSAAAVRPAQGRPSPRTCLPLCCSWWPQAGGLPYVVVALSALGFGKGLRWRRKPWVFSQTNDDDACGRHSPF